MDNHLFTYPKEVPEYIEMASMYRITKHRTFSHREKNVVKEFDSRLKSYAKQFKIKSEPIDSGDIILFREKDFTLEIYRTSNSVWWTHNELAYREEMTKELNLPEEKEAIEIAEHHLKQFKLNTQYARFKSLDFTEIAISNSPKKKPQIQRTEVQVNFTFYLDDIPVMGPGAKIQVSITGGNELSELLYFWREPIKEKTLQLIHPVDALKKLTNDPRFMRLSSETANVNLHKMQFGYYAMTPSDFQRYLIPVYAVDGTVNTKEFERYEFTDYIVAVDLTPEDIKASGIVADPASCTVF